MSTSPESGYESATLLGSVPWRDSSDKRFAVSLSSFTISWDELANSRCDSLVSMRRLVLSCNVCSRSCISFSPFSTSRRISFTPVPCDLGTICYKSGLCFSLSCLILAIIALFIDWGSSLSIPDWIPCIRSYIAKWSSSICYLKFLRRISSRLAISSWRCYLPASSKDSKDLNSAVRSLSSFESYYWELGVLVSRGIIPDACFYGELLSALIILLVRCCGERVGLVGSC